METKPVQLEVVPRAGKYATSTSAKHGKKPGESGANR